MHGDGQLSEPAVFGDQRWYRDNFKKADRVACRRGVHIPGERADNEQQIKDPMGTAGEDTLSTGDSRRRRGAKCCVGLRQWPSLAK